MTLYVGNGGKVINRRGLYTIKDVDLYKLIVLELDVNRVNALRVDALNDSHLSRITISLRSRFRFRLYLILPEFRRSNRQS